LIKQLPESEKFCLVPQMRRAAISVTNNIAEGHGRWHFKENIRFCRIARGSIEEVHDDLTICEDEQYGDQQLVGSLMAEGKHLLHRVNGYIAYLRKRRPGEGQP
jgi:four helix bundle protein